MGHSRHVIIAATVAFALVWAVPAAAQKADPSNPESPAPEARPLQLGDSGPDVRELQIQIAGWFPRADQRRLKLTGKFDLKTANALKAFQKHYKLPTDGTADADDYGQLAKLTDPDGTTKHFDWGEFDQNFNSRCSKEANRYAGTFKGGPVSNKKVKEYVRRLMWRLEALRAKQGDNPIGINSGYRSVAYNKCIGGASMSQHLYGAAADLKIAEVHNHDARDEARHSQFHGIACYSGFSHNHLDIRLDNVDLSAAWYWYWPKADKKGRELADDGKLCLGEKAYAKKKANALRALRGSDDRFIPTLREVEAFQSAHDDYYGGLAD